MCQPNIQDFLEFVPKNPPEINSMAGMYGHSKNRTMISSKVEEWFRGILHFQQKSSHVTWKGSKSSQKNDGFRSIREPPMTWLRLFKRQENLQCFPQLWNWRPDFKQSPESSLQSLNTTIHFKIPFKSSSSIPTSRSVLPGGFYFGAWAWRYFVCYFVEWAVLDRRGAASRDLSLFKRPW